MLLIGLFLIILYATIIVLYNFIRNIYFFVYL